MISASSASCALERRGPAAARALAGVVLAGVVPTVALALLLAPLAVPAQAARTDRTVELTATSPRDGAGSPLPSPGPPSGPAPPVAPDLGTGDPALLLSEGGPSPGVRGPEPRSTSPDLAGPPTGRRLGLPVTVALVALLGAASLVVRVLLAEPVPR